MSSSKKTIIVLLILIGAFLNGYGQKADTAFLKHQLDSIILDGIDSMAYPGAQVLIKIGGITVYHQTYGHHTYEGSYPVKKDDIYDFASITKVTTGLPILMKLYGEGRFDLDTPLKDVFGEFKKSNMSKLTFRDMLAHRAGLTPYLVFWRDMLDEDGRRKKNTFSFGYSIDYPIKITDNLFLHKDYKKKMYKSIKKSEVDDAGQYRYSGLLFLLLPDLLEPLIGDDFESFLYENFYVPMGLTTLTYNPRKRFPPERIIPTEYDDFFRYKQIRGTVHDEAAAMLNGLSCNAGLFGAAEDLANLFQMYLNGGTLYGRKYIDEKAVLEFTRYQFPQEDNHRGLGFDKPLLEYDETKSYVARDASKASFGHSGFTGTFVWADPEYDMVFVFLSNRVYPTRENRKLYSMGIRAKIHQAVYQAIDKN